MTRLTRGSAWVAILAVLGAIAASSDPGMPDNVKLAAVIAAAALNGLHVTATHGTARQANAAAVAITAHKAAIAQAQAAAGPPIVGTSTSAAFVPPNATGANPIPITSDPAAGQ